MWTKFESEIFNYKLISGRWYWCFHKGKEQPMRFFRLNTEDHGLIQLFETIDGNFPSNQQDILWLDTKNIKYDNTKNSGGD